MRSLEHNFAGKRFSAPVVGNEAVVRARRNAQTVLPVVLVACAVYMRYGLDDWFIWLTVVCSASLAILGARAHLGDLAIVTGFINSIAEGDMVQRPHISSSSHLSPLVDAVDNMYVRWHSQQLTMNTIAAEIELLFNVVPEIMFEIDKSGRIVKSNSAGREIFGNGVVNRKLHHIIDNPMLVTAIRNIFGNRASSTLEVDLSEKCGRQYSVAIKALPSSGFRGYALVLLHDITEQKNKDRIHSDFIANAGHEMRTPLTTIFGFIETMRCGGIDEKTREEFLEIISAQCIRIKDLLSDMEQLYSMDTDNNKQVTNDAIDLESSLHDIMREFAIEAKKREIRITLINKLESEAFVNGDRRAIHSVLSNLLSNAIKYCHSSSEIRIIAQDERHEGRWFARIKFMDQSPGIPASHISRLTERFYRADVSHSSNIPGKGLGLAIVKSVLAMHEGRLEISSSVGQGSEFSALLPLC